MKELASTISRREAAVIVSIAAVAALVTGYVGGIVLNPTVTTVPAVKGFYKGQEILFIHTEASDPQVASMLGGMTGSPVFVVPSLNQIPPSLLGEVYVFKNGLKGAGPFGFQSDVFDSVPSDPNYTPLRLVYLVVWNDGAAPRELRSVEDIKAAEAAGQLTIMRTNIVVNMPIIKWPGGQR